jgi:hypothetical protein
MRSFFVMLCLLFLSTCVLFSQSLDSITLEKSTPKRYLSAAQVDRFKNNQNNSFRYQSRKQKQILCKDHLIYYTDNILILPIESEITDLESRESTALSKRDTAALIKIWARDFTLDEPNNKLVISKNPLPYYVAFVRTVEKLGAFDNVVFTSGYESFQKLLSNGKLEEPIKRNFSHTWTREHGVWKLTASTHD